MAFGRGHLRCRFLLTERYEFFEQGFQCLAGAARPGLVVLQNLGHLDERQFHKEALVAALAVALVALVAVAEGLVDEAGWAFAGLLAIAGALALAHLQEG